ncbi:MAG: type II toxin-antitoxin system PemK/MazF family toxin [bacterium]
MNTNKFKIKQGDLCLVNFEPSKGYEYQGKRPALIIQSNQQILKSNLVTVIPLTSNLNNKNSDDILIKKDKDNNLISNSIIKVFDIHSFDYSRFINKIGRVDEITINRVKKYLKIHFDL